MTHIAVYPNGKLEELAHAIPASSGSGEPEAQAPAGTLSGDLGVQVGPVGFEIFATLGAQLGRVADGLERDRRDRGRSRIPHDAVTPLYIPGTPVVITGGAGSLDVPQLFGPTLGRMWDIRSITAQNFTAGTVQPQRNAIDAAGAGLVGNATGVTEATYGKCTQVLQHGDRLTFACSGITATGGGLLIIIRGTVVAAPWWSNYAL